MKPVIRLFNVTLNKIPHKNFNLRISGDTILNSFDIAHHDENCQLI
jgi:hypothetical protein